MYVRGIHIASIFHVVLSIQYPRYLLLKPLQEEVVGTPKVEMKLSSECWIHDKNILSKICIEYLLLN